MNERRSSPFGVGFERWSTSSGSERMLYRDFSTRIVPYRSGSDAYAMSAEGMPVPSIEKSLTLRYEGVSRISRTSGCCVWV